MAKHECSRDGDHFPKIAKEHGIRDWKALWDENSKLQKSKKRSNPMMLFTGDKNHAPDSVELPKKKKGKKGQATSAHGKYVVPTTKVCLRLRALKGDFSPLADRDFELKVDGVAETFTGKTDASGRIKVDGQDPEIPVEATKGQLTIRIKPEDFGATEEEEVEDDTESESETEASDVDDEEVEGDPPVVWELKIGALNPVGENAPNSKCLSGVQQRLNNLGLNAGPVDGINGPNTKAAVEAFQSLFGLGVDGIAGKKTQPKLRDIHDTEKHNGTAPGQLEIKHPVPPDKRLETTAADIGYVTPDLIDASSITINTLVIRPTYRISIELGDIDALCPEEPNTAEGRRRRLQLLGYLYENLASGTIADAGNAVWSWYTGDLGKSDADLKDQLDTEIVEGGALPAEDEIKRIRFPGGFCYSQDDASDALRGRTVGGNHAKFNREDAMWNDNSVLGAIPVIVKVECKTGDDQWSPKPGMMVYLQLQKPDDLEDADKPPALRDGTSHFTPTPASSPAQFVKKKVENFDGSRRHRIDAKDPQVDNAHSGVGGKRGLEVAGNIFEIDSPEGGPRKGFYAAHDTRALDGRPPFYEPAEKAPADKKKHLHAVRARTNEQGEAGFIFKPARTGGDRYKLRAYLGPGNPEFEQSDGTGIGAVRVDTGTMVVWRRLRFSRNLYWDYPGAAPAMPAGPSAGWGWAEQMQFRAAGGLPAIDLANVGTEFAKGYQDVVVESTAARTKLTGAEWTAARNFSVGLLTGAFPNIDFDTLIPANNGTMFVINVVDRATYNANKGVGFPNLSADAATYWSVMSSVVSQFKDGFMQHLTKNALPFTIVHSPFGDSLTYNSGPAAVSNGFLTTSGVATPFRGAFVFWGSSIYQNWTYPRPTPITAVQGAEANTVHESGHCHYGPHHWTSRSSAGALSGGFPHDHDQKDYCIMGYITMEGDFCGRCILKHRGWNVVKLSSP